MKTNDIIVLDNGDKFTLLYSLEKDGETYFLASKLTEDDKFDQKSVLIIKAIYEDGEKYIDVINDEKQLAILTKEFQKMMNAQ